MNSRVWLVRFYGILGVVSAAMASVVFYFLSFRAAALCLLGAVLLGAGFKLTEILVGILTKTRSANWSAMALVFLFKLAWWGLVFWVASQIHGSDSWGIAAGFGAFLLALLLQGLMAAGWPKLSPHNKES